jgi:hypothetical protein
VEAQSQMKIFQEEAIKIIYAKSVAANRRKRLKKMNNPKSFSII